MPHPPAPVAISEADYDLIEAAVMETGRGRWFLAEYARRNRHADTLMLLGAIDRLEAALRGDKTVQSIDRIRVDLFEMAKAIARTKSEIAAIRPETEQTSKFGEVTAELDSILQMTETATTEILSAAELVQEIGWTLQEQGADPELCDMLNARATEIYTACGFQDLTGQRTGKVIQVLRYLEGRINAMMDIWGLEAPHQDSQAPQGVAALDPPTGYGLDQADIDVILAPEGTGARDGTPACAESELASPEPARVGPEENDPPQTLSAPPAETASSTVAADAFRPFLALSPEEKIALFS